MTPAAPVSGTASTLGLGTDRPEVEPRRPPLTDGGVSRLVLTLDGVPR